MAETKRPLDIRDDNRNGTELDELQAYLNNNSQVSREFVKKYIDALTAANSKKLLKNETRAEASELLRKMLDQKLITGVQVSEPQTLDIFIKSGLYDNVFLERCRAQLVDAKTAALKLAGYGEKVNKVVFDLKMQKNGKLNWKSGFGSYGAYEKLYQVPLMPKKPVQQAAKNPDITDKNDDGTNLDELQRYMRDNQRVSREMVIKYIEALSLAGSKQTVKAETRAEASEFLKKMLDQRLSSGIKVTEPETLDLFIKSGLYNNEFLLNKKAELIKVKATAQEMAKYGQKINKIVFDLRLKNNKLIWKSDFGSDSDEKMFQTIRTDLTDDRIHGATKKGAASSARVDNLFAEMTSMDKKLSEIGKKDDAKAKTADPAEYLRISHTQTAPKAPEKKSPEKKKPKMTKKPEIAKKDIEIKEGKAIVNISSGVLNIRSESGDKIGNVAKGKELSLTGECKTINSKEYLGISLPKGKVGYVAKEFLLLGKEKAKAAVEQAAPVAPAAPVQPAAKPQEKQPATQSKPQEKQDISKEKVYIGDPQKIENGETVEVAKYRVTKNPTDGQTRGEIYENTFDVYKKGSKYNLEMNGSGIFSDDTIKFDTNPTKSELEAGIRNLIQKNTRDYETIELI